MSSNLVQKLQEIATPIVERNNAYVVDLIIRGERSSKVVELYVDSDTGIKIEECITISREFSGVLDEADVISGRYRIDVSSPDLMKPLKMHRQYKKNIGRVCKVARKENNVTVIQEGILKEVTENAIMLSKSGKTFDIAFSDIVETYIVPRMK